MTSAKILIVEDEENLGETLKEYFQSKGHSCSLASSVQEAKELFKNEMPQIVLMDIGLPDGNGIDLAKEFKTKNDQLILLFLSALNDPEVRVKGLELGAEDYITKPFALKELTLRMERLLATKELGDHFLFGSLEIHFDRFELVDAAGSVRPLGKKDAAILRLLLDKKNQVVTREEIIENVWGHDQFPSNRTVDNYIVGLRKWAETDSTTPLSIQSVRGVGYKLNIKK